MNPLRRRRPRPAVPGQTRPDGLHLERIPVTEQDPGDAGRWEPGPDGSLARLAGQLASLREALTVLGRTHAEDKTQITAREQAIAELVDQLAAADRALKFYGASHALLTAIAPSATALLFAGRLPAVPVHPETR